jgi:hypothetical protein
MIKDSPLLHLLSQIRDSFREQEQAYVLRLDVAPWKKSKVCEEKGLENWLKNHFTPVSSDCTTLEEAFDPFICWEEKYQDGFFQTINTDEDPAGNLNEFWSQVRNKFLSKANPKSGFTENSKYPQPLFEVIDVTSLLTYPNWRLALDRSLKLLKPGGWVIFPEFYKDALLLDGRVADWVKWNNIENHKLSNRWCKLMYRSLRYIEREFNRPWIPELGLCESLPKSPEQSQPRPLYDLLIEFCDEDTKLDPVELNECSFTLQLENPLDLLEIPCLSKYISESEFRKLRRKIEIEAQRVGEDQREIRIGCQWNALQLSKENDRFHSRVDTVITQSLISEHRNFLDSSHFLLPEFSTKKTTSSIEAKILRSLRGFVCRMIHHDRFDQDNHHLFVASLWLPEQNEISREVDLTMGKFAHVTGCVFRRDTKNEDDEEILDEALSQISYWAHAQANGMTLQSIPQLLFDSDRPVIRVLTGEKWEYELRGYGQLDLSGRESLKTEGDKIGDWEDVESAVFVPSEITIRIPDLDKNGQKWQSFKTQYVEPLLNEVELGLEAKLGKRLRDEIWTIREGKVFSFPWNMNFDEGIGEEATRGRPAGFLTKRLADEFKGERNILVEILTSDVSETVSQGGGFTDMMNRLLDELGICGNKRSEVEKEYGRIFNALVALTLAFPASSLSAPQEGLWELLQAPIGAFIDSEQGKFVSAGSCLLIRRASVSNSRTRQKGDDKFRLRLCQMRSTQIMRRVPTVLLPLSTLLLANLLIEEERRGRQRRDRAEAARGLLHNLRNLIAPALAASSAAREEFNDWLNKPESRYIDNWFVEPEALVPVDKEAEKKIISWRKTFIEKVNAVNERFNERVSTEMVQRTIDAYYWYLSEKDYPEDKRDDFKKILASTVSAVWETWGSTLIWEPVDKRHSRYTGSLKINMPNDKQWQERTTELFKIRGEASGSPLQLLKENEEGQWWFVSNKVGIRWKSNLPQSLISYPSIAFHVLYELIWNGLKYVTSEVVLYGDSRTPMMIDIVMESKEDCIKITYKQPCFGETLEEIVSALNNERMTVGGKLPEMSGIQGLRSMIDRCKWIMEAIPEEDLLHVTIIIR